MFVRNGDEDTICAVATPPGAGGIAVVRVSGSQALSLARAICPFLPLVPESHRVYFGTAVSGVSSEPLDEVLVTYFKTGRSFTGEETIEVSCHGGPVLSASLLKELVRIGCRMARRGEFTYRAFMNGRMDLVQAESVLALIESQSKQAAGIALRQLKGHLSDEFKRIEDDITWILAHLEASIDFSTEDIDVASFDILRVRVDKALDFIDGMIRSYDKGRILRDGLQVALVGRPNVGKSSLLNVLLNEDRAIVTAIPGTTRDVIDGRISYGGVQVTYVDTAGIRETGDEIEKIGIERSRKSISESDIVFYVLDLSADDFDDDFQRIQECDRGKVYLLVNKVDTDADGERKRRLLALLKDRDLGYYVERTLWVSAVHKSGVDDVHAVVERAAQVDVSETSGFVTQARHYEGLQIIQSCLRRAADLIRNDSSPEFMAFELQESVRVIHELLGKEFDDQVMDRVFREFCIGK